VPDVVADLLQAPAGRLAHGVTSVRPFVPACLPEGRQYSCRLSVGGGLGGSAAWPSPSSARCARSEPSGSARERHRVAGAAPRARAPASARTRGAMRDRTPRTGSLNRGYRGTPARREEARASPRGGHTRGYMCHPWGHLITPLTPWPTGITWATCRTCSASGMPYMRCIRATEWPYLCTSEPLRGRASAASKPARKAPVSAGLPRCFTRDRALEPEARQTSSSLPRSLRRGGCYQGVARIASGGRLRHRLGQRKRPRFRGLRVSGAAGLEPATAGFGDRCSAS
jgi:hypothetical protein